MTLRKSIASIGAKVFVSVFVAGGLALVGCSSDTVPPMPDRAAQIESAQKNVDQSVKSKSGKSTGPPIVTKSVKSLIKKGGQG
jgi:hypothetical protein